MKDYFLSKLKSLTSVLIDSLDDLAKGKEDLREDLQKCEEEVAKLSVQIDELKNKKVRMRKDLSKCE